MNLKRRLALILLLAIFLLPVGTLSPTLAQTDPPMLALLIPLTIGDRDILGTGQLVALNANGTQSLIFQIPDLEAGDILQTAAVSRDRQWVAFKTSPETGGYGRLIYQRASGGSPTILPAVEMIGFSPDSRYLLYFTADIFFFNVGIVNLATGSVLDLYGLTTPEQGLNGAGVHPVHFDGRYLYGTTFLPASDSGLSGLYRFDLLPYLRALTLPNQTERHTLPAPQSVVTVGNFESMVLSPNGRYIALLYHDPANPPVNVEPGPFTPSNTLALIDLQTRSLRRIAQAGPGQILRSPTWAADSGGIAFVGGTLPDVAGAYAVSVPAGAVRSLGTLSEGRFTSYLGEGYAGTSAVAVCGSRLYYGWERPSAAEVRVFRSPTNNLANFTDVGRAAGMALLGCAA